MPIAFPLFLLIGMFGGVPIPVGVIDILTAR